MPEPVQSSWADEIEEGDSSTLPAPTEKVKGDTKVVTEYIFNEDGKKVKVMRTYKIERKMVPKSVAQRRSWAKFGMSKGDKPGPNPQVHISYHRKSHRNYLNLTRRQLLLRRFG